MLRWFVAHMTTTNPDGPTATTEENRKKFLTFACLSPCKNLEKIGHGQDARYDKNLEKITGFKKEVNERKDNLCLRF